MQLINSLIIQQSFPPGNFPHQFSTQSMYIFLQVWKASQAKTKKAILEFLNRPLKM